MQTSIIDKYKNTYEGADAEAILRSCVHCGFCTATCPTYQLLGDELDGPRGRIYIIKNVLEGNQATRKMQLHLDRCLTCRSCETTCPSGVQYGHLLDIGRNIISKDVKRPLLERIVRKGMLSIFPYPSRFRKVLRIGQLFRPFLPGTFKAMIPTIKKPVSLPEKNHKRTMLILKGCAQSVVSPDTNAAAARILDRSGIRLIEVANTDCCGSISHHLAEENNALDTVKNNIDAWWPYLESGAEAIIVAASGCGLMLKDYGNLLKHDKEYADKAKQISSSAKDLCEVLELIEFHINKNNKNSSTIAFQAPCTLQHGQDLQSNVENILTKAGFKLTNVPDSHICCGSAGTYSILQSKLSGQLLTNKLKNLEMENPDMIVTANIGCQLHLQKAASVPVIHWIELLEQSLNNE